ncbi:MAG: TetR/AcrR family transcriptional regulator C-terminal domain-containing protein [Dermatophilaceae bacterium]
MPLRRQDVVQQALELLDDVGFPDLTMRRLASALGVQPGALYWHVENKQSLLAAVAEAILAQVGPVPPHAPWPERLRAWADQLRQALCRYRDGAEVVASVLATRTASVDPAAQAAEILRGAGMPRAQARIAGVNLLHFVLGHSVDVQGHAFMVQFGVADTEDEQSAADVFAAGLDVWLAGLAAFDVLGSDDRRVVIGGSPEPSSGRPAADTPPPS